MTVIGNAGTSAREAVRVPARNVHQAALGGSVCGMIVAVVESLFGSELGWWVGNKYDTVGLGAATAALSAIAFTGVIALSRDWMPTPSGRFVRALLLLVPAQVGFTTAGPLWWIPGSALGAAAVVELWALRHSTRDIARVVAAHWTEILVFVLGLELAALGSTALGSGGLLGLASGVAVMTVAVVARRLPKTAVAGAVGLAVVPYGVVTWWSVIVPAIAVLALLLSFATTKERSLQ